MKIKTALFLAMGLVLSIGTASASITWYGPDTVFHDDDLDAVIDVNQNGVLDTGDRLISVVEFHDTESSVSGGPSGFGSGEVTAIADVTVTDDTGGILTFGASGAGGLLGGFAAGTTVAVFSSNVADLDVINGNCGTQAQCINLADNGGALDATNATLLVTLGFFGDADNFWTANGTVDLFTLHNTQASGSLGQFSFGQSIGIDHTGKSLDETVSCFPYCYDPTSGLPAGNGLVMALGNGQIKGGAGLDNTQWDARSKADVQVEPIPEPASLALMGLGLIGIAGLRLRAKSRS